MSDSSKTASNSEEKPKKRGRPFVKGDPRINRKGRPKKFDGLRILALQIAHETVKDKDGEKKVISGRVVTVAEMILRQWAMSRNAQLQRGFMEVAFGKVPMAIEHTGKIEVDDISDEARIARIITLLDAARDRRDRSPSDGDPA